MIFVAINSEFKKNTCQNEKRFSNFGYFSRFLITLLQKKN